MEEGHRLDLKHTNSPSALFPFWETFREKHTHISPDGPFSRILLLGL